MHFKNERDESFVEDERDKYFVDSIPPKHILLNTL